MSDRVREDTSKGHESMNIEKHLVSEMKLKHAQT